MIVSRIVTVTLADDSKIEYKADSITVRDGVLLIVRCLETAEDSIIIAMYAEGQWKSATVI